MPSCSRTPANARWRRAGGAPLTMRRESPPARVGERLMFHSSIEVGFDEAAVHGRAAFAEHHRGAPASQLGQRIGQVDGGLARHQDLGHGLDLVAPVGGGAAAEVMTSGRWSPGSVNMLRLRSTLSWPVTTARRGIADWPRSRRAAWAASLIRGAL